jgi:hypothetical protein
MEKKELDAFSIGVGANGAGVVVEYAYAGFLVEIAGAQIRRRDHSGVRPSNFDGISGSGRGRVSWWSSTRIFYRGEYDRVVGSSEIWTCGKAEWIIA